MRLPDEMCAEDAAAFYRLIAERNRYRIALERIATPPFHMRVPHEIAREALRPPEERAA